MSDDEINTLRAAAKEALRQRMSQLRRALPEAARRERAEAMCAAVVAHPLFAAADTILAYSPLRFEIDPGGIVRAALLHGKTVALPRVDAEARVFHIHQFRAGDTLAESGHLILEPSADAPEIAASEVGLVLVPGLAFDAEGQRLGFGQGYYDRMLPKMLRATRMGLCYELSLLPEVPSAAHDVAMHAVATDKRILTPRAAT
jgi:5-formyltetrahydrofolate cyclo-ligase